MNVIFLDIYGTISEGVGRPRGSRLSKAAVARVEVIARATDAYIVISSDTVKYEPETGYADICQELRDVGLTAPFAGYTLQDPGTGSFLERGREIRAWLDAHPIVQGFVILDDMDLPLTKEACDAVSRWLGSRRGRGERNPKPDPELAERFVQVADHHGLRDVDIEPAIARIRLGRKAP